MLFTIGIECCIQNAASSRTNTPCDVFDVTNLVINIHDVDEDAKTRFQTDIEGQDITV